MNEQPTIYRQDVGEIKEHHRQQRFPISQIALQIIKLGKSLRWFFYDLMSFESESSWRFNFSLLLLSYFLLICTIYFVHPEQEGVFQIEWVFYSRIEGRELPERQTIIYRLEKLFKKNQIRNC